MQQDHIARLDGGEVGHQACEIDAAGGGVEIAVFGHLHAEELDDRGVVRPGRVGNPDGGIGCGQRISSSACRIAPVPPGVATEATRSVGTASPRIMPASAAL
jgi:hypothetical protein